ncbi:hypothetical protein T09_6712 [Trichinella sp. T9]|nr:hypothetical protein T09_6712 [Trichinella sp. T9]
MHIECTLWNIPDISSVCRCFSLYALASKTRDVLLKRNIIQSDSGTGPV